MVSACLNFEMQNADSENPAIGLQSAWPLSDDEGRGLEGYTFTVENKCSEAVNYVIALESLEDTTNSNYLNYEYVKLAIDDEIDKTYESLTAIDNVVLENDAEVIRETREVTTATVAGNTKNTHTIRIWIAENAPLTEQNKSFKSRVRITGGQGVENTNVPATADSCFTIDENGEILGYDESCGTSVVIPARVNGVQVKTIDSNAFKNEVIEEEIIYYDEGFNEIESLDTTTATLSFVVPDYEPGTEALDITTMKYAVLYVDNEITAGLETQLTEMESQLGRDIPLYKTFNGDTEPELEAGQIKWYQTVEADGDAVNLGGVFFSVTDDIRLTVSNLDLSKATFLNVIEPGAFSLLELQDFNNDGCVDKTAEISDNIPTGLTSLIFGEQSELKVGYAAFAGLDVEELTVYTNLKGYSNCSINNYSTAVPFAGSNINILNVNSVDGNDVFSPNTYIAPFIYSTVSTINVNEGVKELGIVSLSGITPTTINLTEGLEVIGKQAFASAKVANINIPNSVKEIGVNAFYVMPSTSTITFKRTEADVTANVILNSGWNGSAQVIYET